ncbi:IclR family transcriptional regulator [Occultella aeris]|uniref:Transcriptional regulator KdgR n=1 Tax=Occultella aeris TaxID=2761496 RepID=A0A7M4DFF1_9MICO|nr:IclR family transcriptional regulator [Occultella aeris]VZO35644.1 Transcriptional regulator KdgR [Occultella aeris]
MTLTAVGHDPASASALVKGLRVLEAVGTNHRVTDIAASTGLSYGTVHRILSELVAGGWVVRDAQRHYHPGPRQDGMVNLRGRTGLTGLTGPAGLTEATAPAFDLAPVLMRLRDTTGLTVHLATLTDADLVYAAKVEGPGSYLLGSHVGRELPLHATAIGKAYLATLDPERAMRLLAGRTVRRLTAHTLISRARLLVDLSQIRDRGWAFDNGENEDGVRCVGVALTDPDGVVRGGLSVSGPDAALSRERIPAHARAVTAAGAEIEAGLAGSPT